MAKKIAKESTPKKSPTLRSLHFEASEFATYHRTISWYGGALALFALIVFVAIYMNDLRLAFIIVLGAIVFYSLASATPNRVGITVSPEGLSFRNKLHPWSDFKSFALLGDDRHLKVALYPLSHWRSPIVVPVPKAHAHPTTSVSHESSPDSLLFITAIRLHLPQRLKDTFIFTEWVSHFFKF